VRLGWPIAALLGLVLPERVLAQLLPSHGPYVSIGGGALQTQTFRYDSVDTEFHLGSSLEVAAGYNFGNFRADLSYVYGRSVAETISLQLFGSTQNLATTGAIQTNSLFLNGTYYVPTKHKMRPYFGGGVGYTRLGVSMGASGYGINYEFVGSGNTLGYQAKLGVAYQSTPRLELFAEGIYRGLTMGMSPYASLDSFGVQAGLRYHFHGGPTSRMPLAVQ
jgi:opacity protein-like surface antigen